MIPIKYLKYPIIAILLASLISSGCSTRLPAVDPTATSRRELTDTPDNRILDKPSVGQFMAACDNLSRELSSASIFQNVTDPVVLELRPIEDRTGQSLDLTIYPQTIREKLMNMGNSKIVFRDETIRDSIINERIDQFGENIRVSETETSTITGSKATTRTGSFKGPGGVGTPFAVNERKSITVEKNRNAEVSSKIASVDYFLTGFVYLQDERTAGVRNRGYRFYRFQFRLTNAQNGLVVWEKAYDLKNEGVFRMP